MTEEKNKKEDMKLFFEETKKMLLEKKLVNEKYVDQVTQDILDHIFKTKKKLTPYWMKKILSKYQEEKI